jgi:hypothetical protein
MTPIGDRVARDCRIAATGLVAPAPVFADVWTAAFVFTAAEVLA